MDDNGHLNGTLTWLNITSSPCTEKLGGDYKTTNAGNSVHFSLLGLVDPPPVCRTAGGKGFSGSFEAGQRKLTLALDPGATCDNIYLDKQR